MIVNCTIWQPQTGICRSKGAEIMQNIVKRNNAIRRRILIVEDEPINRRLLGKIVETNYEVLYAANGAEALIR